MRLKGSWTEPAVLWAALVAPSGAMKSAPLELGMTWARRRHNALFDAGRATQSAADELISSLEADLFGKKPPPPPPMPRTSAAHI